MSTTINHLVYGDLFFTDHEIQEGEIYETAALLSDALEIGTLQVELYLRDESKGAALTGFHRNDTLLYYHRDKLRGTYYIEQVERTGKFTYSVTASDALGLLDQSSHMGGIYTGQTVGELVAEICNIPYQVQSRFAKIKLYGWLPVATRRSNLAQVLFAVGAQAKVDQYGALRIEALWDGVSSAITPDRIFWGDRVRYEARVTEVSVLEHQYIPGTEEVQLFEGTTQSGDVIQFQEPVHSLEASGFSLLEYGANYARVSAGTGILTGKKYDHTTRDVRQAVTPSDVANVVEVKEATLVSLVNSAAVAERLADYYKFIESMEATVVYDGERPGDVIAFEHPFGGASVGCVKSASITIGGKLVAQETTAIGYRPTKMEDLEYLDGLEVEAEFFANYWGIVDSSLGESYADLDETLQADIIALYKDIYSHSKYEVKQAVRQEDGSYTVQVLVDPIDVMQKASDLYDNDGYEPLNAFWTKMNQMDPASVTDTVYAELTNEYGSIIVQMVREQLDSLGYLEQKSLSIQVQEDSDGYLSINQDDWGIFDSYVIAYP